MNSEWRRELELEAERNMTELLLLLCSLLNA